MLAELAERRVGPAGFGAKRSELWFRHHKTLRPWLVGGALHATPGPMVCPPVMDQRASSSCTGHAAIGAAWATLLTAGKAPPWTGSQRHAYTVGRCIANNWSGVGPEPELQDEGTSAFCVGYGLQRWGCIPMGQPSTDESNSDCDPATINEPPALDEMIAADPFREHVEPTTIYESKDDRIEALQTALDARHATMCIGDADDGLQLWTPDKPPLGALTGKLYGGHAWYIYAYRIGTDGKRVFTARNSWGRSFGRGGDFDMGEERVKLAWELHPMALKVAS